jgi:hypothetical protein
MIIYSSTGVNAYNLQFIESFFISSNSRELKCACGSTRNGTLGKYANREECKLALEILMKRISENKNNGVVYAPAADELPKWTMKEHWHHATGKKTKSHGGS